jgi:hypothetical protein
MTRTEKVLLACGILALLIGLLLLCTGVFGQPAPQLPLAVIGPTPRPPLTVFPPNAALVPQPPPERMEDGSKILNLKGKCFDGEMKVWLCVDSESGNRWNQVGYEPRTTRIYSQYPPVMRRLPNGIWEIAFMEKHTPYPTPTPCP